MLAARLSFLAAAFTACLACAPGDAGRTDSPLSVLLVSIDTLRADHLGTYGYAPPTSPFIDRLASQGVVFENAISSSSWTLPAHASLLSGLYPSTHRAVEASESIAPSVPMAAELFAEQGYATAGFVASWFVSRAYGFDRGFSRFEEFGQTREGNNRDKIDAARVVDAASEWLRGTAGGPFFLFVHFYDPHFDYAPPDAIRQQFATGYRGPDIRYRNYEYYRTHRLPPDLLAHEIALYDGEIRHADSQLERLVALVEEMGAASRTLILVTSDHGEEFFERGSWGHAHTLYDEQVRVPLIVRGPGIPAGRRVAAQVRHVDVLPTLAEAAGLPPPPVGHGRSILAWLTGKVTEAEDGPRPAYLETARFGTNMIGLRRDGWKLLRDLNAGTGSLFHLASDGAESIDLAGRDIAVRERLDQELSEAALAFIPDRWLLRWFASDATPLEGTLTSPGRFLRVIDRTAGGGGYPADAAGSRVGFKLPPGGVLEAALLPVDSAVTLTLSPADGGAPLLLGREAVPAAAEDRTFSARDAERLAGIPTPLPPAAGFWLEQSRGVGGAVHLSEEEMQRLESLGYVMR